MPGCKRYQPDLGRLFLEPRFPFKISKKSVKVAVKLIFDDFRRECYFFHSEAQTKKTESLRQNNCVK